MTSLISRMALVSLPTLALIGIGLAMKGAEPNAVVIDEVLAVNVDSLTHYLAEATATPSNGVQPTAIQRGVGADGAQRASAGWGMALGASPLRSTWRGSTSLNGVDLRTGSYSPSERDIALVTDGVAVGVGRSYNGQQNDGTARVDSAGLQGNNWAQAGFPEILLWEHATDAAKDVVYMTFGADRFVEFQRYSAGSVEFQGKQGTAGYVAFTAASGSDPELYVYTDRLGTTWTFFGHDGNAGNAAGQLWKAEDADGKVTYSEHETNAATAAGGFDASGGPSEVFDPSGRRFSYTYTSGRLTEVKAETKTGGTWASPTGLATVAEVDYEYYTTAGTHGSIGDLMTVVTSTQLSDTTHIAKQFYRYWRDADAEGDDHMVKLVLSAEGVRQYDLLDSLFDDDHESASDAALSEYASHYFEYDGSGRVSSAIYNGECGCSGGTIGQYNFTYEVNPSYTDNSGYDTTWATRTIVERPDGSYLTQYFDEIGQGLSQVITDADPAVGTPDYWATQVVRSIGGVPQKIHSPANVTGYTHTLASAAFTTSTTVGLVNIFTVQSSGGLRGFLEHKKFQEGTSGSEYLVESYTYSSQVLTGTNGETVRPMVASVRQYPTAITSGTTGSTLTSYAYTYHSGTLVLETATTTNPVVATANNGSGSSTTSSKHYDGRGRQDFAKSEDGTISYSEYSSGVVTKSIRDADTTKSGAGEDFNGITIPSGFASSGSPIHQVTSSTYDAQGRRETTTLPSGRVTGTYRSQTGDRALVTLGYPKIVAGSPSTTYYGPVSYSVSNLAGKSEASGKIALTGNTSTAAQSAHVDEADSDIVTVIDGLGELCRLTTTAYDESGGTAQDSSTYFLIPASGLGTDGTNYDKTTFAYNGMGKRIRTVEPSGTIRRRVYDAMSRVTRSLVGTDDTGLEGSTTSGTSNMVATDATEYDDGNDGGNSLVTKHTRFVLDGTTGQRVTAFAYEVRGNLLLQTNPTAPHSFHEYDNQNRRIESGQYSSTANIVLGTDNPVAEASNRLALGEMDYDEMGRAWKTTRHEIDAADGSTNDTLTSESWYNAEGQVVKREGSSLTKTRYDGLGRSTHRFTLAVDNDTVYANADDVSGDIVLQESQTVYDPTSGLVLMRLGIDRHHDDKGIGETTGELDTNADSDGLKVTAANVEGRVQISATWYDSLDRAHDTVHFGTYGGSDFDRDAMSVPSRSDTALRSTRTYGIDGGVEEVEDPKSLVSRIERDDAGRTTKTIQNYDSAVNSGYPSGTDDNVTVKYEFTDGLRTKQIADLPTGSTDQETVYTYSTAQGTDPGDSKIATGHLLQKVQYPDSAGGTDVVTFAYDAQSAQIWKQDQAGNIFEREFDSAGRQAHRRVTTLATGFDGDVRRISTTYDNLGRRATVVQYDNDSTTSGSATDGAAFTYDSWGNISEYEEDRNSAVSSGTDEYSVSYTWQTGELGRNTVRKDTMTLPSGAVLDYDYRFTSGRHDSDVSRVTSITHGTTLVASYQYNGVGRVVDTVYNEIDVMSRQYGATGVYPGLDRFNRVASSRWTKDLATDRDFYAIDLAYDRNSNITLIEDGVHAGFDVRYTMDDVDRLTRAEEGTWNGSAIASRSRDQEWTLDQVGNWDVDKVDLDGDGTYTGTDEVNDQRSHNDVNEITGRDIDNSGTDDYALAYDAAGNLTDDGESYKYEYDAFYRLRKVKNQSGTLIAEHHYNGLGHRIAEFVDTDDDGDVDANDDKRYFAYDERWRITAHFLNEGSAPTEEFVHHTAGLDGRGGSSYIDLVVLRERDTTANGTLDERMYYCQNWRADVSAIVDDAGEMYEWAKYSAYGVPFGLPGADTDSDGDCDATDINQIRSWILASGYDVRGDVDLDGDVDATDKSIAQARLEGVTLGRDALSHVGVRAGYAGYERLDSLGAWHARNRSLLPKLGAWSRRDPLGYIDGQSLVAFAASSPLVSNDPMGLTITVSPGVAPNVAVLKASSPKFKGSPLPLVEAWVAQSSGNGRIEGEKRQFCG